MLSPELALLDWRHLFPVFLIGFQIGPRIRVGGTIGKIGQGIKTGVGKIAQPVGKVVSLFNPALGTAISTVGDVLDTTDGKFNVGRAAMSAAGQYGAGKVLGSAVKHIPGVSGLSQRLQSIPGVKQIGDMAHNVGHKLGGLPGADQVSAEVGRVKRRVAAGQSPVAGLGSSDTTGGSGGGSGDWMDKILLGGAVAAGTEAEMRRRRLQDQAAAAATGSYNARAPLRAKAIASLQDEQTPDYSDMFADPGNVYSRPASRRLAAPASPRLLTAGGA